MPCQTPGLPGVGGQEIQYSLSMHGNMQGAEAGAGDGVGQECCLQREMTLCEERHFVSGQTELYGDRLNWI